MIKTPVKVVPHEQEHWDTNHISKYWRIFDSSDKPFQVGDDFYSESEANELCEIINAHAALTAENVRLTAENKQLTTEVETLARIGRGLLDICTEESE